MAVKFGIAYKTYPVPKKVKFWADTIKGLLLVFGGFAAFSNSIFYTYTASILSFLIDRVVVFFGEENQI